MPEVTTTRCLSCGDEFAAGAPYREVCPRCMLVGGADAVKEADNTATPAPALESPPGTVLGNYILREKIGEGGFGIVYRAEQTAPVKREVALKVIKRGMDTGEVVARFSAERQALALMDHPNVSTVFDAGATPGGRPYFVMELVDGEPITVFCDHHGLGVRERLPLFIDVCHAVQHAHQKGILHRDIKPSNVLVKSNDLESTDVAAVAEVEHFRPEVSHSGYGPNEDTPLPNGSSSATGRTATVKVIDFGVAKALHAELTEETLYTAEGRMLGTPEYMSPEQTGANGGDVDTRSDVYALGVLLYELLTGTTPLDSAALRNAGYGEMERMIREVEPPRPSARAAEEPALARSLRGDLDWIVLKAIEKDRDRRYESAGALADDLARHLADEPVTARPPTTAYRVQKFARRNKPLVTGVAAVFVALFIGAVGMTVLFFDVRSEKKKSETQFQSGLLAGTSRPQRLALTDSQRQESIYEKTLQENPENTRVADLLTRLLLDVKRPGAGWEVLKPAKATSEAGASLNVLPDSSILVEGVTPANDSYDLEYDSTLKEISALRIETLTDPRLPSHGPGRKETGNFIMTEFTVRAGRISGNNGNAPVRFRDARDDYHIGINNGIGGFVDDGQGNWSVRFATSENHWAVLEFVETIDNVERLGLSIRIGSGGSGNFAYSTLGRFRISATDHSRAIDREQARFRVLALGNPLIRLGAAYGVTGDPRKAAEWFAKALDTAPNFDEKIRVIDEAIAFDRAFDELIQIRPDDASVHLGTGMMLASRGQWKESDLAFREAVEIAAEGMPHWIQTGYWRAGPYPLPLESACAPENNSDPFLPSECHWESVEPGSMNRIALANETCDYFLTRVWSPVTQKIAALTGKKRQLRLFVNGSLVYHYRTDAPFVDGKNVCVAVPLETGWTTIVLKAKGGVIGSGLRFDLSDSPRALAAVAAVRHRKQIRLLTESIDAGETRQALDSVHSLIEEFPANAELHHLRARCLNNLERWDECLGALNAAVEFASEEDLHKYKGQRALLYWIPNGRWENAAGDLDGLVEVDDGDAAGWKCSRDVALVRLLAGNREGFRTAVEEMGKRIAQNSEMTPPFWAVMMHLLISGMVTPDDVQALQNSIQSHPNAGPIQGGIYYRVGRLEDAGGVFRKHSGLSPPRFLFLAAMSWHHLGESKRARESLERANRLMANMRKNGLHGAIPRETTWQIWACNLILQREANAMIQGTN